MHQYNHLFVGIPYGLQSRLLLVLLVVALSFDLVHHVLENKKDAAVSVASCGPQLA